MFAIHLTLSFIPIAVLTPACKWEPYWSNWVCNISLYLRYNTNNSIWMSLVIVLCINVPFIITGILFILALLGENILINNHLAILLSLV